MKSWKELCSLKRGDVLDVRDQHIDILEDGVCKTSDIQYLLTDEFFDREGEQLNLLSFYWASSEAGFRRAYYRDIENDDLVVNMPPAELISGAAKPTYKQIKNSLESEGSGEVMEHASYRVMSDGAFIHKSLECRKATYYFRSLDMFDDEIPYAILWKVLGIKTDVAIMTNSADQNGRL